MSANFIASFIGSVLPAQCMIGATRKDCNDFVLCFLSNLRVLLGIRARRERTTLSSSQALHASLYITCDLKGCTIKLPCYHIVVSLRLNGNFLLNDVRMVVYLVTFPLRYRMRRNSNDVSP